ncbi:MAG: hypothetical protein AB8B87_12225 [Granulosicoccus sp.]
MKFSDSNKWMSAICSLGVLLLVGCDNAPAIIGSPGSISLSIENPLQPDSQVSTFARSFNPEANPPSVTINGQAAVLRPIEGGQYEVTGTYPSNITVDVVWSQLFERAVLELATVSKSFTLRQGGSYSINAADYITNFDSDRDLDTNLFELKDEQGLGLNPRNSNLCTQCRSDVASHINRITPAEAPTIDGNYETIWNRSQFKDINGEAWLTSNGASESVFRFASMHDDQNLYLYVLREPDRDPSASDSMTFSIANIDQNQPVDVFDVFDLENMGDVGFTFQNGSLTRSGNVDATVAINNGSLLWEARVDLGSLGLLSDRFALFVGVGSDSTIEYFWDGVVVLKQ